MTKFFFACLVAMVVCAMLFLGRNQEQNGFRRVLLKGSPTLLYKLNCEHSYKGIAGKARDTIYLFGNDPGGITGLTYSGKIIKHKSELAPALKESMKGSFFMQTKMPWIFTLSINLPALFLNHINSSKTDSVELSRHHFTRAIAIDTTSLIIRCYDGLIRDQLFEKISLPSGKITARNQATVINHDNGLSTDGMLVYDEQRAICAYVYYYKNAFLLFDKQLNLIQRGQTIDTVTTYRGSPHRLHKGVASFFTNTTPARVTHSLCAANNGKLYIYSKLKADNESPKDHREYLPIDVYSTVPSKYLYSFYIPNYERKKLKQFLVQNDTLVALYDKMVKVYKVSSY